LFFLLLKKYEFFERNLYQPFFNKRKVLPEVIYLNQVQIRFPRFQTKLAFTIP
jgi:hypothetical protein